MSPGGWSQLAARFEPTSLWPVIVFGFVSDWDLEPDEHWEELAATTPRACCVDAGKATASFRGLVGAARRPAPTRRPRPSRSWRSTPLQHEPEAFPVLA